MNKNQLPKEDYATPLFKLLTIASRRVVCISEFPKGNGNSFDDPMYE